MLQTLIIVLNSQVFFLTFSLSHSLSVFLSDFITSSPFSLGLRRMNSELTLVTPVVLETRTVTLTAMTSTCNPGDSLVTVAMEIANQWSFCTSVIKSFLGDCVCVYIFIFTHIHLRYKCCHISLEHNVIIWHSLTFSMSLLSSWTYSHTHTHRYWRALACYFRLSVFVLPVGLPLQLRNKTHICTQESRFQLTHITHHIWDKTIKTCQI